VVLILADVALQLKQLIVLLIYGFPNLAQGLLGGSFKAQRKILHLRLLIQLAGLLSNVVELFILQF